MVIWHKNKVKCNHVAIPIGIFLVFIMIFTISTVPYTAYAEFDPKVIEKAKREFPDDTPSAKPSPSQNASPNMSSTPEPSSILEPNSSTSTQPSMTAKDEIPFDNMPLLLIIGSIFMIALLGSFVWYIRKKK